MTENASVWLPNKEVRPRLNGPELLILYKLLTEEEQVQRRREKMGLPRTTPDDYEAEKLKELREKVLENLNNCRREGCKIDIREKVLTRRIIRKPTEKEFQERLRRLRRSRSEKVPKDGLFREKCE